MRKSALFISAVLTTFALVILYGVVSAYRGDQNVDVVEAAPPPTETPTAVPTDIPTPTPTIVTPEEAAQIAAKVVGSDKLLSAEISNLDGIDAYLITFTNKDVVYVGLDGQVLSVQVAPVVISAAPPVKKKNNNKSSSNQSSHSSEGEHEGHDD